MCTSYTLTPIVLVDLVLQLHEQLYEGRRPVLYQR